MAQVTNWDPFVRMFHWSLAALFLANSFVLEEDGSLHAYVGYAVLALVSLRIGWGFVGPRKARFQTFLPTWSGLKDHLMSYVDGRAEEHVSHNPLGALMVFNLLGTMVLIGVTGWLMRDAGLNQTTWLADLHELLANYALACVGLHVVGVLIETRRTGAGLLRAMTTGKKEPSRVG